LTGNTTAETNELAKQTEKNNDENKDKVNPENQMKKIITMPPPTNTGGLFGANLSKTASGSLFGNPSG